MICDQAEILLHLLSDREIDAGHARNAQQHAAECPRCAETLRQCAALGAAMARAQLRFSAPASLRARIENGLPRAPVPAPRRLSPFRGFALGAALSAAAAASVLLGVLGSDGSGHRQRRGVGASARRPFGSSHRSAVRRRGRRSAGAADQPARRTAAGRRPQPGRHRARRRARRLCRRRTGRGAGLPARRPRHQFVRRPGR